MKGPPLSLSGPDLDGECLVRLVYVDESGISANESIMVVAAVMIHADSQWVPVEQHIGQLIEKYVAKEDRRGFVFHATELYFGSGKIFGNRQKYPLEKSREMLKEILSIPARFQLPIVFGFTRKEPEKSDQSRNNRREERAYQHGRAFTLCAVGVEKYMRNYAKPSEIATITAEDNTETKKTVKWMLDVFRSPNAEVRSFLEWQSMMMKFPLDFLPLRKIIHTVHFAAKSDAFLLQLADACAFILRYYIEEKAGASEFIKAFAPHGIPGIDMEKVRTSYGGMCEVRCWD